MPYVDGIAMSIKRLRDYLISLYGYKCQLCERDFSDKHYLRDLTVHHKLYDEDNSYSREDFQLLCRNCNTKLSASSRKRLVRQWKPSWIEDRTPTMATIERKPNLKKYQPRF